MAATDSSERSRSPSGAQVRVDLFWPVPAALLLIVAAVPLFRLPLNFDASGFLHGAGRLLDGGELYVDFVDPNPPLVVLLSLPAHLIAAALGIDAGTALKFCGLAAVAASLLLTRRILGSEEPAARALLITTVAFALTALAGHHFIQREHLLVALGMPYLALVAARIEDRPIAASTAWLTGGIAALGFLLKPFYLAIWIAVEALHLWRRRSTGGPRPEAIAVVASALAYAAAVISLTPGYRRVAVWGATLYRSYVEPLTPLDILVDRRALPVYALIAVGLFLARRRRDALRDVLLVALLAYLVGAVAVQAKSFDNHWYPVAALALVATVRIAGDVLVRTRRVNARALYSVSAAMLVIAAVASALLTTAVWTRRYETDPFHLPAMAHFLEAEAGARSFFTLGATLRTSFPLATETEVPYVSPFLSLWTLAGSYPEDCAGGCDPFPYHKPGSMPSAENFLFRAVVADFVRQRPGVVIVDDLGPRGLNGFQWIEYFSQDPGFAAAFEHYHVAERVGRYRLFVRNGP